MDKKFTPLGVEFECSDDGGGSERVSTDNAGSHTLDSLGVSLAESERKLISPEIWQKRDIKVLSPYLGVHVKSRCQARQGDVCIRLQEISLTRGRRARGAQTLQENFSLDRKGSD